MRLFWQHRSTRERILMIIGIAVLVMALWMSGINSLLSSPSLSKNKQQFQTYLQFIQWGEHVKPFLEPLKKIDYNLLRTKTNEWPQAIQRSLKGSPLGESLSLVTQKQNQLTLIFKHAPFDALMQYLTQWQMIGIKITALSSQRTSDQGYCNVSASLMLPIKGN